MTDFIIFEAEGVISIKVSVVLDLNIFRFEDEVVMRMVEGFKIKILGQLRYWSSSWRHLIIISTAPQNRFLKQIRDRKISNKFENQ